MAEKYIGVKFKLRRVDAPLPRDLVAEFLAIDRSLSPFVHPARNEGNLSVRAGDNGFLIKRTGAKLTTCTESDVVLVLGINGGVVTAAGGTPSSESRMHKRIYDERPDAGVVLHFHDDKLLESADVPAVGPFHYGTEELAEAVGRAVRESDIIKIRGHGLVVLARDKDDLLKKMGRLCR